MLKFQSDRILALDIGSSKLVLAEFSFQTKGLPELTNYGIGELGIEYDTDADPTAYIVATLRDLLRSTGIHPAPLLMTLSGQTVFPRYVKLPAIGGEKLQQMIRYEAEQNVPFPISEVIWDFQRIGEAVADEQNILLMAVKTENATEMTDCVQAVGLEPDIVDVAPMALYNCVRYNYPDADGCTMVLDIGARSTNLLLLESERIFTRNIPVAGNAITQDLAKSFQVGFREAEELKQKNAFVALGGVYSAGNDETVERISKIVRNVVTRLHAEVNRSINFYRSQQNGSPPDRVLLTGRTALIPHMDTFFREKLRVEIDFLNPFVNVAVGNRIDAEASANDLFLMGPVVGLALRRALSCPVEINLMPPSLVERKMFRRRLPYFGLAVAGVVFVLVTWALHAGQMQRIYERQREEVDMRAAHLRTVQSDLRRVMDEQQEIQVRVERLRTVSLSRTRWARILDALREALLPGMWLTHVEPVRDGDGHLTQIRIHGKGFQDALDAALQEHVGDATAMTVVELLRNRLRASPVFGDAQIVVERPQHLYLREFVLRIVLRETES